MTPYLSEERGEMKKGRAGKEAPSYSVTSRARIIYRFPPFTVIISIRMRINHSVVHFTSYGTENCIVFAFCASCAVGACAWFELQSRQCTEVFRLVDRDYVAHVK